MLLLIFQTSYYIHTTLVRIKAKNLDLGKSWNITYIVVKEDIMNSKQK